MFFVRTAGTGNRTKRVLHTIHINTCLDNRSRVRARHPTAIENLVPQVVAQSMSSSAAFLTTSTKSIYTTAATQRWCLVRKSLLLHGHSQEGRTVSSRNGLIVHLYQALPQKARRFVVLLDALNTKACVSQSGITRYIYTGEASFVGGNLTKTKRK